MHELLEIGVSELSETGLTVRWQSVPGADAYRVLWSDSLADTREYKAFAPVGETRFRFARSTHVPYTLKVQALDEKGEILAESGTVRTPVCRAMRPQLEPLGRGLVAVCTSDGVFLSWRLLRDEVNGWTETGLSGADFIVYKNGEKLTAVTDRTSWRDGSGTPDDEYAVAAVYAGSEQPPCAPVRPWRQNYIDLPLQRPADGVTPAGEAFSYRANDMSVGDVDGDGEYEFIVKWDPTNSKDVSERGYTGRCILECYRLDGTLLWRLDMGPNIRAGAHYTQFMVYDFNGDGAAEMAVKTAPGTKMTRFAPDGTVLGSEYVTMPRADLDAGYSHEDNYVCTAADYRENLIRIFMGWAEREEVKSGAWPQTLEECWGIPVRYAYPLSQEDAASLAEYFIKEWAPARSSRNRLDEFEGFIFKGPEYLTMFSGMGRELDTIPYKPAREDDGLIWGDYECPRIEPCNRVDRFLAGVAYLDGERPYLLMCRGYYTRACAVAYDFFENKFHEVWCADSGFVPMKNPFLRTPEFFTTDGTDPVYSRFAGQGNHSLSTADVDGDGCMELIYGAAALDQDGSLLYSSSDRLPDGREAKLGHGDAMHVAKIDPDRPGLQIFNVFEDGKFAPFGYAMRDAETGKAFFGEYAEDDLGRCMVGDIAGGVRGLQVWVKRVLDCKGRPLDLSAPSTNMRVYWAGDLTTQFTDGPDYLGEHAKGLQTGRVCDPRRGVLLNPEGTLTNNGTKGNPCLVADIFGDWREELLLRLADSSAIRIFTSTEDAPHKLFTLMQDPQYRCGVAWQNNCYNQPVYPSFYYASDMDFAAVLPVQTARPTLFLAGDSLMQSYDETETPRGWGQALAERADGARLARVERRAGCEYPQERRYILPELIIDNCAIGGRSSRSFAEQGRLDDVAAHLACGDYLLVQFGRNDADESRPERFVPLDAFALWLQKYVDAAKNAGALPVLVTPLPRLDENGHAVDDLAAYSDAMRALAQKENVPCFELGAAVLAACEKRGDAFFMPDGVHLTAAGAAGVAGAFARLLRESGEPRLAYLRTVFGAKGRGLRIK